MGLLSEGTPLDWEHTKPHAAHVRKHGIQQLINIYHTFKDRSLDELKWGDEIEYIVVRFDNEKKKVSLSLKDSAFLKTLQDHAEQNQSPEDVGTVLWHPEYASYMLESTPGSPYGGQLRSFLDVEANMRLRRLQANSILPQNEKILSMTNFPRLGCPNFTYPEYAPRPTESKVAKSLFFPDEAINQHPRFATLTANIRERRGAKVCINVPVFRDINTAVPFTEEYPSDPDGEGASAAMDDHIYLDAMGFGMGCCCLQVTFQTCNITEARMLYDQLAVVSPIVLALSASSPIFRGILGARDCRWDVIAGSVDDRPPAERGCVNPQPDGVQQISKSRYDSISNYISTAGNFKPEYNDLDPASDDEVYKKLRENGFDHLLAQHFAHLFIRDPLALYQELLDQDDERSTDHFENIQSTNWQTMRFKPPPADSPIGWRVEFRPTEVQLTEFENAAFVIFIVLLTRVILSFDLNLYIPLSKVDENMQAAQKRDAVRKEVFYFRKQATDGRESPLTPAARMGMDDDKEEMTMMSIDEIINGKRDGFPGLIGLINSYLRTVPVDLETRRQLERYMKFISKRASGELPTTARWMREFVLEHPEYQQDSIVTEKINYDLLQACIAKSEEGMSMNPC